MENLEDIKKKYWKNIPEDKFLHYYNLLAFNELDIPDKLNKTINPKLPSKFYKRQLMNNKPRFIVIHDTNCLEYKTPDLNYFSRMTNIGSLKKENIIKEKYIDLNYHFIIDKIGDDYEIFVGRPLMYRCAHKDISPEYQKYGIHVIILADLSLEIPTVRFYPLIAYRLFAPLIFSYKMPRKLSSTIVLHKDIVQQSFLERIKKIKNIENCPGNFFFKDILFKEVKKYV